MKLRPWFVVLSLTAAGCLEGKEPETYEDVATVRDQCREALGEKFEPIETRCDGIDNDCDGAADRLLPIEANACEGATGSCTRGFANCEDRGRVCRAPACDPVYSPATSTAFRPRALLLQPSYLEVDGKDEIATQISFFEQWGIPYDVAEPISDLDAQLSQLANHTLAVFPGYVLPEVITPARLATLRAFVETGGVLIVTKPVLTSSHPFGELLGVKKIERRLDLETLRFGDDVPALARFDSPEERVVPLTAADGEPPPEVFLLHGPAAPIATGWYRDQSAGAVIMRLSIGRGVIYTLGHDLHTFRHARCYVNCFEPSGDLAGLFLRGALRESARGHVALLHTVAGAEDGVVLLTHDVDALDAYREGPAWGKPGALRVAELEARHDARGSFMITTDYVTPYYEPRVMAALCARGMCPVGVHSVTHGDTRGLPAGDCTETLANYPATRTLCGEVRIPLELVERDSGQRPVAWRSPYLYVPERLYDVLESQGIGIDSSYAVGDLKFNLPISLARTGLNQHLFHRRNLYTVTITLEDGFGEVEGEVIHRVEMSDYTAARFSNAWTYAALRNADNDAYTVALLHPSFGHEVPEDNLRNKLAVLDAFLESCRERNLKTDATLADVLEFWRAREATKLDARYTGTGYAGSLQIGPYAIENLTLEFGDPVVAFRCTTCGDAEIVGNRVVLHDSLPAGSAHLFEAN